MRSVWSVPGVSELQLKSTGFPRATQVQSSQHAEGTAQFYTKYYSYINSHQPHWNPKKTDKSFRRLCTTPFINNTLFKISMRKWIRKSWHFPLNFKCLCFVIFRNICQFCGLWSDARLLHWYLTLRKMSKIAKTCLFFKKLPKIVIFFPNMTIFDNLKEKVRFGLFFNIKMTIFRRFRLGHIGP